MDNLPIESGTYALILSLDTPRVVTIGRLGEFTLPSGFYIYLGSAHGPGGLRARLGRHLRGCGKPHWHIDYLKKITTVRGWVYAVSGSIKKPSPPLECQWSQLLTSYPNAIIPVPKFGASDCHSGCPAHLIHFPDLRTWQDFTNTGLFTTQDGSWLHGGSQGGGGNGGSC